MFQSISRTFELMKTSWRVLMQDRELMLFPVLSGIAIILVGGLFAAIALSMGTFGRIGASAGEASTAATVNAADIGLFVLLSFVITAIAVFFNAALISAALERLNGGDPTVRSGLNAALGNLPPILGWAAISATVGLLLQLARSQAREGALGMVTRFAIAIVGGVWAYLTFFVVPIMVAERLGPLAAIKRSKALFRQTWGNQAVAGFGFGLIYVGAILLSAVVGIPLGMISPLLGMIAGVAMFAVTFGAVAAMEGIFKAALYGFATGQPSAAFDNATLRSAYRAM